MTAPPVPARRGARSNDRTNRARHAAVGPRRTAELRAMLSLLQRRAESVARKPAFALMPVLTFVAGAGVAGALSFDHPSGDLWLQRSGPEHQRGVEVVLGDIPGANPIPALQPPRVAVAEVPDGQPAVPTDVGSTAQEVVAPDLAQLVQGLSPPDQIDQDLQQALADLDEKADRDEAIRQQKALEQSSPAEGAGPSSTEFPVEHRPTAVMPTLPGPEQIPPGPTPQP
jgi:hypothetical protein